ncbi:G5 domain-containing protein [Leifsonia sp. YIM 134122]|uniref:G5 domain-containing protein n=1 Tax=Leifsonia stereocauli TaxID=3134136 RepID=A0ABU9W769_9MICO
MANSPAGWFDDGSGRQRWWDGNAWTERYLDEYATPVTSTPTAKVKAAGSTVKMPGGRSPKLLRNILFAVSALVVIIVLASSGWAGLLLLIGIAVLAAGIYALVIGSFKAIRVKSRAGAVLVLVVGLAVVSAGGSAVASANRPSQQLAASQVESTAGPTAAKKSATPTPTPTPTPVRTTKQVEERTPIPYTSSTVDDANLDAGATAVAVVGVAGEKLTTWSVIYQDGVEISRSVASEVTSVEPVNEVISNGTRQPAPAPVPVAEPAPAPAPGGDCDSNYADACVPISSDVDCAGGSGNGPAYVAGPVRIVGSDIYDLDRDGDGIACD